MKLTEVMRALDSFAPLSWQEEYDNAGLAVGNPESEVSGCLVCLDVTAEVIREAVDKGASLVISHHPVIFKEIKQIREDDQTGLMILDAIRGGISLYSMHTNLDNVYQGVNQALSTRIGLTEMKILRPVAGRLQKLVTFCPEAYAEKVREAIFGAGGGVIGNYDYCSFNTSGQGTFRANEQANPFSGEIGRMHVEGEVRIETILPCHLEKKVVRAMLEAHPYEEVAYDLYPLTNTYSMAGSGMMGRLTEAMDEMDFILHLKKALGIPCVRHSQFTGRKISVVAVCGGSGGFLLKDAMACGADAFLTAELKYHQFFDARGRILMIDAGHYETEQFTVELITAHLKEKFPNFAVHISEVAINPVNYL